MPPLEADEYFLDRRAVRRAFDAASSSYTAAAAVQAEIRNRLLERLDLIRLQPASVLDLGSADGQSARALKARYPAAEVIALDLSERMLALSERRQRLFRRFHRVAGDAQRLPIGDAQIDLAFSSLTLEWCTDPDAVFRELRRVLRPGGVLMFTTLGPDTLKELREAWRMVDAAVHVHRFIDMHDLGDALLRARYAEPVMDVERLTVTYADLGALLAELRASGSTNVAHGRRRALTGRRRFREFEQRMQAATCNGALALSVEVIYGHAWASDAAADRASSSGEVRIPVSRLGRRRTP